MLNCSWKWIFLTYTPHGYTFAHTQIRRRSHSVKLVHNWKVKSEWKSECVNVHVNGNAKEWFGVKEWEWNWKSNAYVWNSYYELNSEESQLIWKLHLMGNENVAVKCHVYVYGTCKKCLIHSNKTHSTAECHYVYCPIIKYIKGECRFGFVAIAQLLDLAWYGITPLRRVRSPTQAHFSLQCVCVGARARDKFVKWPRCFSIK